MPLLQVTGNNLRNQLIYNPKKIYGDKFDVEHISSLSLFLYEDALTLLAKDRNTKIIAAHSYSFENLEALRGFFKEDLLLNAHNTAGKLHVHNNHFCIVPGVLFDPTLKSTYLNFSTKLNTSLQEVFYEGVDNNNIQVVGAVEKEILDLCDHILPDMEVTHGAVLVLSYLFEDRKEMLGQEIFAVAQGGFMYLAAFSSGELVLFNRFKVESNEDFLKYIFAVMHQLGFNRMLCRISVLGDLEKMGIDMETLMLYFKNIVAPEPKNNLTYSPGTEAIKESKMLEVYWNS